VFLPLRAGAIMPETTNFLRCLRLVSLLNAEHDWGLTQQQQRRYAEQIILYCPDIAGKADAQLSSTLHYYHKEHALVEALHDPAHPDHADRWDEWTRQCLRILAAKIAGAQLSDAGAVSLEDLAQEANLDLWRGLAKFSYQSSFHTWAFTVIAHCVARHYRSLLTQKRGALAPAQSLDNMLAVGDTFQDHAMPSPDALARGTILAATIAHILAQQPDQRLPIIFQLWANEEQTLRSIGEQLHLSPARVHALLKQAIALLQDELVLQDWAPNAAQDNTTEPVLDDQ
jgi:RNA polymerase sigma factor (sigma-70 family)